MNRFLKINLLIVGVIVIMLGMEVKHRMDIYNQIKQEEIKIAQSKEAIEIYEQELKWLDPNALTNEGTIKSYSIDLDSITLNPMGGFSIHLIINDDPDTYLRVRLSRYDLEGNLEIASNYRSEKLEKLLKGVER
ncbi:TPA: DUF1310 family protein [Streptococcus equi subsp. zooepidemicus]|uniref:DUF1310 family protein n=1 Tax=Streptococcus equi subsp. zooepidemicus (strain MGCS10565) TaxID=552526 RepID=B4U118_STREM|nr:DUF1310 family protein [Streptococcus equi]ACG63270.1 hypothetical protein Sez_1951 [Streptococcus equi subsp. zooepidemicus MGCS10565]KIS15471.1 membrane protein [Streptococcus equi subsp. zooepidemicus SzAM35]MCD3428648.1 DUF1310 domain-containing protein [Streptococcus equi subsp. zooepidemicus]MDI6036308.1 DUF1310 family protein [Streptococcus equi subsp. zooepidemicus]QZA21104.1 DUF1310 domain-containing protein [Streptococcus equi subsp. zooepidemicus]